MSYHKSFFMDICSAPTGHTFPTCWKQPKGQQPPQQQSPSEQVLDKGTDAEKGVTRSGAAASPLVKSISQIHTKESRQQVSPTKVCGAACRIYSAFHAWGQRRKSRQTNISFSQTLHWQVEPGFIWQGSIFVPSKCHVLPQLQAIRFLSL